MTDKKVNPALVIGMGGTGQWILTHLKRNLIESYETVPKQVRLLAFDTTTSDPEVAEEGLAVETVQIGQYQMNQREEFVYLGGNIKDLCQNVANKPTDYPHIANWFQSRRYLTELNDDDFSLARGAGTRRPFGRLAVFFNFSEVVGKIERALNEIKGVTEPSEVVEIYIISSLAGGTGSGMFIDLAHLVRIIARNNNLSKMAVRGFFVLHKAFQSVAEDRSTGLNTYAALLELERFMVMFGYEYPIRYTSNYDDRWNTIYSSKLFDSCFLVDAERNRRTLSHLSPQSAIYPSVADCLTMLLDPAAGDRFQQHYKNINDRVAIVQRQKQMAMYSSLGAQVYVLPINNIVREFELRFAEEFLANHFAYLPKEFNSSKRPSTNISMEQDALAFLKQDLSLHRKRNTPFVQGVAMYIELSANDPTYLKQLATEQFLALLRASGEEENLLSANRRLDEAINQLQFTTVVRTSADLEDPPENAAQRIRDHITELKRTYLGGGDLGHTGLLQQAFTTCSQTNLQRFQELLVEKLNDILSGHSLEDYGHGRLGYARFFLDYLLQIFDTFSRFLEEVQRHRSQTGSIARAREEAQRALNQMEKSKSGSLLSRLAGNRQAISDQVTYIELEQYLVNLQTGELVLIELLNQAQNHRQIIQEALNETNHWVTLWVTGEPVTQEVGVLPCLRSERAQWKEFRLKQELVHQKQNTTHLQHYLTDTAYEELLYERFGQQTKIDQLAMRFKWSCRSGRKGLEIVLTLDGSPLNKALNGKTSEATMKRLLNALKPYFKGVKDEESVVSRLEAIYTPEQLADQIWRQAEALISLQKEHAAASDVEKRIFVSLNPHKETNFVNNLKLALSARSVASNEVQVIESTDPYRCVVLATTDLFGISAVPTLQQVQNEYNRLDHLRRNRLHVFPAEVNATAYESRLGGPGLQRENIRHFTARVTALFEDEEKLNLFIQAYAVGAIREEESREIRLRKNYVLRILPQIEHLSELILSRPLSKPSLFEAMHTFVFARPLKPPQIQDGLVSSIEGRAYATHSQISEIIRVREESIIYNMRTLVDELVRFLMNQDRSLHHHRYELENTLTSLLVNKVNKFPVSSLEDAIHEIVWPWLDTQERDNLITRASRKIISSGMGQILLKITQTPERQPERLQRHLQDFSQDVSRQLRQKNGPDEQDLAAIVEMITSDYRRDLAGKI